MPVFGFEPPYQPEDFRLPGGKVPAGQRRFEFQNVPAAPAVGVTEPPRGVRFHGEAIVLPVVDRTGAAPLRRAPLFQVRDARRVVSGDFG